MSLSPNINMGLWRYKVLRRTYIFPKRKSAIRVQRLRQFKVFHISATLLSSNLKLTTEQCCGVQRKLQSGNIVPQLDTSGAGAGAAPKAED